MAENKTNDTTTQQPNTEPAATTPASAASMPPTSSAAKETPKPAKRKVIRVIPEAPKGASKEDVDKAKAEASHLRASRWPFKGAPQGGALAGRVYEVDADTAAFLVSHKGWSYV